MPSAPFLGRRSDGLGLLPNFRFRHGFCFSGSPARRPHISLGMASEIARGHVSPRFAPWDLRPSWLSWARPYFARIGWGELRWKLTLPGNRMLSHADEAFPAVYRAPGLLGTFLVMNSQGFADNSFLTDGNVRSLISGFTCG